MSPPSLEGTNLSLYSISLFPRGEDGAEATTVLALSGSKPSLVVGLESGEGVEEDPGCAFDIPNVILEVECDLMRFVGEDFSSSESLSAAARNRLP